MVVGKQMWFTSCWGSFLNAASYRVEEYVVLAA
jgi:hypothetical protein